MTSASRKPSSATRIFCPLAGGAVCKHHSPNTPRVNVDRPSALPQPRHFRASKYWRFPGNVVRPPALGSARDRPAVGRPTGAWLMRGAGPVLRFALRHLVKICFFRNNDFSPDVVPCTSRQSISFTWAPLPVAALQHFVVVEGMARLIDEQSE